MYVLFLLRSNNFACQESRDPISASLNNDILHHALKFVPLPECRSTNDDASAYGCTGMEWCVDDSRLVVKLLLGKPDADSANG